jgi:hypothetical protein
MLCRFAQQFPPFVEEFIERGRRLRRRFREETITDLMMGSLIIAGSGRIKVDFPNEPVTGADMEWNFVDATTSTFFRVLLQAKQVYGDGNVWTRHGYKELFHTSGTGNKLQAQTLCDSVRMPGSAAVPLYVLYHPAHTCGLARAGGITHLMGVNLVDGFVIERMVKAARNRTLRTHNKSLRAIVPHMLLLSELFCPMTLVPVGPRAFAPSASSQPFPLYSSPDGASVGFAVPPTPTEVRNRIAELRREAVEAFGAPFFQSIPEIPAVAHEIPEDVRLAMSDGTDGAEPLPLNHWRVTFVSTSPREPTLG